MHHARFSAAPDAAPTIGAIPTGTPGLARRLPSIELRYGVA